MTKQYLIGHIGDTYRLMQARVRETGEDKTAKLPSGVFITLGHRGTIWQLTVRKAGGPFSTGDEVNIRSECRVPQQAIRSPEAGETHRKDGVGTMWRFINWHWTDGQEAP